MADSDEDGDDEPAVTLGEKVPVEGAPLARISSRLHWPIQKSEIDRLEGDSVVRTPDGPKELSELLEDVPVTYFERRQEFDRQVRAEIGWGPVETAEE